MASMAGAGPMGVRRAGQRSYSMGRPPGQHRFAPPGRGRYRSSAGLPPEVDSSVLPHSAPPGGPASRDPTGKTAGQCSFRWGERGDSNPRHPGPQQCCHGEEALENPCLPGIPGPEVGIFTPVEGHLRPCRLPHSWPHSRSPRKLCSSAIRAGCDRSAITSASLQPIRPGTVRQRAGRE
jgi:hypothetical protein